MMKKKITTRQIVMAGMLSAITVVLSGTGIGFIPVPTVAGRATFIHVPVSLAGVLEGPLVAAFTGFIFGLYSFLTPTGVIPADPIVRILPRIFIGVVAYYVYRVCGRHKTLGAALAAIAGTLTNTLGFLGLAVLMGYMPWPAAALVMGTQMPAEMIVAAVLTVLLVRALSRRSPGGNGQSAPPIDASGEKQD